MAVGSTTVQYCYDGVLHLWHYFVSTFVETKAGVVRETLEKKTADGKSPIYLVTKTEWLLLDMTQTDFPVNKPDYLYWDAIIMTRKLLLSIVMNFMTHTPQTQCVLLIIIVLISLVIQNEYKPYYKDNINNLEETTLLSSSLVLLIGLISFARETTDPVFVFIIGLFLIIFICGSGILMFWKILYHWYIAGIETKQMVQSKLKKSFGSLHHLAFKSWGSLNNISNQVRGKNMNELPDLAVEEPTDSGKGKAESKFTPKKTGKLARI